MSYSSRPHRLQHTRLPCPLLSSGLSITNSKDMNLSNLTISSSSTLFSFCLHSFPASGSFPVGSIIMNEASGGDRIPAELFQILKDDAVKVLHSIMPTNLESSSVATGLEKINFHPNSKERRCQRIFKLPYNWAFFTC